jgi:hypothetical protein
VKLLVWKLFYGTPLKVPIEEWVERGVARQCRFTWAEYCDLKQRYPELWQRWAEKRAKAQLAGRFPRQPPALRFYRKHEAKRRAHWRKERPRFHEWAGKKLLRQRTYKSKWKRHRVLDRLIVRLAGF